jgi:stress response protein SCP2
MLIDDRAKSHESRDTDAKSDSNEIVMGLHWNPSQEGGTQDPDDLDALCVLFDAQRRVLEVIHPGNPRNATSSVIHTGDSRTGASAWDDERIFVFLDALPETVMELAFVVASATDRPLNEVCGAACHVTDHVTERKLACLELTTLERRKAHCFVMLYRGSGEWKISADIHSGRSEFLAELLPLVRKAKTRDARDR